MPERLRSGTPSGDPMAVFTHGIAQFRSWNAPHEMIEESVKVLETHMIKESVESMFELNKLSDN